MSGNSDHTSLLLQEYLDESLDIIEEIEKVLLELEDQEDQDHLWDCLMRDLQAFKGSAQLMGLDPIVSLALSLENIITKYRQDKGVVDHSLTQICSECFEIVRQLTDEIGRSGTCNKDISPALNKLEQFSI